MGFGKEYRIVRCEGGGADYGSCERCGKHCDPHYKQQWRKVGQVRAGWTNCGYGHKECLNNNGWKDAPIIENQHGKDE